MQINEVIILAGGFGTRLGSVVNDRPKPLALINKVPFLSYLLDFLITQGIRKVIVSVGYMSESIIEYYGKNYKGLTIVYSIETQPLKTGGAIKEALKLVSNEHVFVCNGDTIFKCDFGKLLSSHKKYGADITIATTPKKNSDRYGSVMVQNNKIIHFQSTDKENTGLVNCGTYIVKSTIFNGSVMTAFSFEDYLEEHISEIEVYNKTFDEYFIDIGIPSDYMRAQNEFKVIF